jgi:hypothetical protein
VLTATTVVGRVSDGVANIAGATRFAANVISLLRRIFKRENIDLFKNVGNIAQVIANSTASAYRTKGAIDLLESDLGQVQIQDKR